MLNSRKESLIRLENIGAGYGRNRVLEKVFLEIKKGDFIGLIGGNGSGKTTLLKVILGLMKPMEGEVHKLRSDLRIGYMPQLADIDREFPVTVEDVVLSGLVSEAGLLRSFTRKHRQEAKDIMVRVGIDSIADSGLDEISGGQMQKVFLARAIVGNPEILVLDEPDAFIDRESEKGFYDILKEINQSVAILLVSHNIGIISSYVKSIACICKTLHYHDSGELTQEILDEYSCPVDVITHGSVAHRVLREHEDVKR